MSEPNRNRRFDGRRQWDDEDRGPRRDNGRPRDRGDRRERDDRDRRRDGDDRDNRRRYRSRSRDRRDNRDRSRSREKDRRRDDDRGYGRVRDDRGDARDRRDRGEPRGEPRDNERPGRYRDEGPPHHHEKGMSWDRQLAFHGKDMAMSSGFERMIPGDRVDTVRQDRHADRRRSASPSRSESPRREYLPTRSKGGEKPVATHPHATMSVKVGAGHDGERGRLRDRELSYEEERGERAGTDDREQGEAMDEDEEELVVEDDGMAAMQAMMGFGGFDTTKGKKIAGNNVGAVRKEKKTEYRQYMNRVGGFNRPLSPSR